MAFTPEAAAVEWPPCTKYVLDGTYDVSLNLCDPKYSPTLLRDVGYSRVTVVKAVSVSSVDWYAMLWDASLPGLSYAVFPLAALSGVESVAQTPKIRLGQLSAGLLQKRGVIVDGERQDLGVYRGSFHGDLPPHTVVTPSSGWAEWIPPRTARYTRGSWLSLFGSVSEAFPSHLMCGTVMLEILASWVLTVILSAQDHGWPSMLAQVGARPSQRWEQTTRTPRQLRSRGCAKCCACTTASQGRRFPSCARGLPTPPRSARRCPCAGRHR